MFFIHIFWSTSSFVLVYLSSTAIWIDKSWYERHDSDMLFFNSLKWEHTVIHNIHGVDNFKIQWFGFFVTPYFCLTIQHFSYFFFLSTRPVMLNLPLLLVWFRGPWSPVRATWTCTGSITNLKVEIFYILSLIIMLWRCKLFFANI